MATKLTAAQKAAREKLAADKRANKQRATQAGNADRQLRKAINDRPSRALPPKGGTQAGSLKATAQRTATAVGTKVRNDMTIVRGLADNMQRNQARDARQIPADKQPSTRYVGPEGSNPKAKALPPGQKGGEMRPKGGAIVKSPKGELATQPKQLPAGRNSPRPGGSTVVNEQPQLRAGRNTPSSAPDWKASRPSKAGYQGTPGTALKGGSEAKALPPATSRPSRADTADRLSKMQTRRAAEQAGMKSTGVRTGQPAGAANRMYGANAVNAAVRRALGSKLSSRLMGGAGIATLVGGAVEAGLIASGTPYGDKVAKAGQEREQTTTDAMKYVTDRLSSRGPTAQEARTRGAKRSSPPNGKPMADIRGRQGSPSKPVPLDPEYKAPPAPKLPPARTEKAPSTGSGYQSTQRTVQAPPASAQTPQRESKASPSSSPANPALKVPDTTGPNKAQKAAMAEGRKPSSPATDPGDTDAPDLERRAAFLDAKDSLTGIKAVKELLKKRQANRYN